MNNLIKNIALLVFLLSPTVSCLAEDDQSDFDKAKLTAAHPYMKEELDGTLEKGEYEIISPNGSITRAICPYTCEDRGLEKKDCKTWQSLQRKTECYVQDLRIKSEAINIK